MKPYPNISIILTAAYLLASLAASAADQSTEEEHKNHKDRMTTVINTSANPVPVTVQNQTDSDHPGRTPYQDSFSLEIDPGKSADKSETFAVNIPAGTRLVITRINVLGELPVGEKLIGVNVDAFVGGSASGNFIGTTFHGTSPSGVIFGGPLDIYAGDGGSGMAADAGPNNFSFSAFRDSTVGTAHAFVQVFGYTVTVP